MSLGWKRSGRQGRSRLCLLSLLESEVKKETTLFGTIQYDNVVESLLSKILAGGDVKRVLQESKLGSFRYSLPKEKDKQLYDFYMSTLLDVTGDKELDFLVDEVKETVTRSLRDLLIDALLFAIAAEIRHVFDRNPVEMLLKKLSSSEAKVFLDYAHRYAVKSHAKIDFSGTERRIGAANITKGSKKSYQASYKALLATKKASVVIDAASKLFGDSKLWNNNYGGKSW